MLSAKYHIAFWIISSTARFVYELIDTTPWRRAVFQSYVIYFLAEKSIFIWVGPTPDWEPWYFAMTGGLLTFIGALLSDFIDNDPRGVALARVIHVLLAFTILGVLEPIRQNVSRTVLRLI